MNKLFYGDCLEVLRNLESESVDLVYLDPPFNSKRDYNAFFSTEAHKDADAQITAFEDTWHWGEQAQKEYNDLLQNPDAGELGETLLPALRQFLANSDMMAYLVMMASRLVELRRVLKPTGSLYLHCDPTASHYLKIILDGIFGAKNFKNEIVWSYRTTLKVPKNHFGRDHDILLFYTKSEQTIFHPDRKDFPVSEKTIKRWSKYADETGFVSNKHFAGSESTIIDTSDESKGFNINMGIPSTL